MLQRISQREGGRERERERERKKERRTYDPGSDGTRVLY